MIQAISITTTPFSNLVNAILGKISMKWDYFQTLLYQTYPVKHINTYIRCIIKPGKYTTDDVKGMTAQVNRMTGQVNRMTAQVNRMTAQVNRITGQVNRLTGQVNRMTGQVNRMTAQINRMFALSIE